MTLVLSLIASLLAVLIEGRYILTILEGKTKPNFSGWLIFSFSMSCVFASAYVLGARDSLLLIGTFTVLHATVAVLSLRYGFVRFSRTDTFLLALSFLAITLWMETANPWYALILNTLVDMFGYMTIVRKLYLHPGTEDAFVWGMSVLIYGLNLALITRWVPEEYLFSLSNALWCAVLFLLSLRRIKGKKSSL